MLSVEYLGSPLDETFVSLKMACLRYVRLASAWAVQQTGSLPKMRRFGSRKSDTKADVLARVCTQCMHVDAREQSSSLTHALKYQPVARRIKMVM